MTEADTLRYARNMLLKLHKSLVDFERTYYERVHGALNAGQFLNVLLEDENFAWLRKFSMLIVEIDEMFDLKDGISGEMVRSNLQKIRELIGKTRLSETAPGKDGDASDNAESYLRRPGSDASAVESEGEAISNDEPDQDFRDKYRFALQNDPDAAGSHAQLQALLSAPPE